MLQAAIVTARESAELLLIGHALWLATGRAERPGLRPAYLVGTVLGLLVGGALGHWVLAHAPNPGVSSAVSIGFLLVVLALCGTLLWSTRVIRDRADDLIEVWMDHPAAAGVILAMALLVGLRESMETVVLLEAVAASGDGPVMPGAVMGLLASLGLALSYRWIRTRLNLKLLYRLSALLLTLIAVESLIAVTGELLLMQSGSGGPFHEGLETFLDGGAAYGWTCVALAVPLVLLMLRRWWRETAEN